MSQPNNYTNCLSWQGLLMSHCDLFRRPTFYAQWLLGRNGQVSPSPPSFEAVSSFICSHQRATVTPHRIISLVLVLQFCPTFAKLTPTVILGNIDECEVSLTYISCLNDLGYWKWYSMGLFVMVTITLISSSFFSCFLLNKQCHNFRFAFGPNSYTPRQSLTKVLVIWWSFGPAKYKLLPVWIFFLVDRTLFTIPYIPWIYYVLSLSQFPRLPYYT